MGLAGYARIYQNLPGYFRIGSDYLEVPYLRGKNYLEVPYLREKYYLEVPVTFL